MQKGRCLRHLPFEVYETPIFFASKLMKYKALLFDLDDTLWATFDNNKASLHRLYDEEGWGT